MSEDERVCRPGDAGDPLARRRPGDAGDPLARRRPGDAGDPLARVAELYAPPPMSEARKRAFDRGLEARLGPGRGLGLDPWRWLGPALAGAAAVVLAVGLDLLGSPGVAPVAPGSGGAEVSVVAARTAAEAGAVSSAWDYELFLPAELDPAESAQDVDLPEPMQHIAAVFLDG